METKGTFTVSAKWMKACGFGDQAKTYPVIHVQETLSASPAYRFFYTVVTDSGYKWIVAGCHGTFNALATDAQLFAKIVNKRVDEIGEVSIGWIANKARAFGGRVATINGSDYASIEITFDDGSSLMY